MNVVIMLSQLFISRNGCKTYKLKELEVEYVESGFK